MPRDNKKILLISISAIIIIIIAIIITIISMQSTGLNDSFFTSDNTKYVIKSEGDEISIEDGLPRPSKLYTVYYYKDDAITDQKYYYKFEQESDAKTASDYFNNQNTINLKSVVLDGNYLILTTNKSEYEGKTLEEVKGYAEFLESFDTTDSDDSETNNGTNAYDENGEAIETDSDSIEDDGYIIDIESD